MGSAFDWCYQYLVERQCKSRRLQGSQSKPDSHLGFMGLARDFPRLIDALSQFETLRFGRQRLLLVNPIPFGAWRIPVFITLCSSEGIIFSQHIPWLCSSDHRPSSRKTTACIFAPWISRTGALGKMVLISVRRWPGLQKQMIYLPFDGRLVDHEGFDNPFTHCQSRCGI